MSTGSRAEVAQPTGHELSFEPRRVRAVVLAAVTTLALAVLSAAAARFDGWSSAPAVPQAAHAMPESLPFATAARPPVAAAAKAEIEALAGLVARKYRVSPSVARDLIGTAFREGTRFGVDPLLVIAVMAVESRFNPIAQSDAGAVGLMQVIPGYHQDKLDATESDPVLDPHANIRLGARVLKEYIARGGGEAAGLQMYNGTADDPTNAYANKVFAERARLQQAVARPRERTRA